MTQATRPYFQSYIPPSNNSTNIEANTGQAIDNRKKQQEQEDKTDFFNQFLMTMALGQFLNGSSGQSAGGAIGSMLGMGLVPVGMQLGDKLFGHLFGKNNEANGVNSRDSKAITEDISRNSVHPQPQPSNQIPENPLMINNPAEQFNPNFSLLGDLNTLGGIQKMLNENIEKERNNMNFWGFSNNLLNRYSGR